MPNNGSTNKPVVLIYAEPLLSRSMTFIRSQVESLSHFSSYYISPHYLQDGLTLPEERVVVMRRASGMLSRLSEVPFKSLGVAPLFTRRLRRLNPKLLHAHFGPMGLRALPLARRLAIPLVVTFHGYDATSWGEPARLSHHYSHRVYFRRRQELEQNASLLIAVSKFVRRELVKQGYAVEKIVVHYIGVDTDLFHPSPDVAREPIVLFTGRLDDVKGCEYLIAAMAKVQSSLPQVELAIIGDGALRNQLERSAHQNLAHFRFLGYQPPEVVRQWMNRATVFAAPSVRTTTSSEEGCPTVLMEAQAMKLPVVSSVSGGIPEVVSEGETGFLTRERDPEAIAYYLLKLLNDEMLCKRMGAAGRDRVCKEFNLRIQSRILEQHYESVISRHS